MLTLRGTPFLYNGEEIGMTDLVLQDISQFRDLMGVWVYHAVRDDLKLPAELALQRAAEASREEAGRRCSGRMRPTAASARPASRPGCRSTRTTPRASTSPIRRTIPNSLLNFYRRMLRLRKQTPALIAGDYTSLHEDATDYLAFLRHVGRGARGRFAADLSGRPELV